MSREANGGADTPAAEGPVTTIVTRRARPGHEAAYERILEEMIETARGFPGHLGVEVFRPEPDTDGEYRVVYRFDTGEHLRAWLDSDEHVAWLERLEPHAAGPLRRRFVVTGLESWFTLPGRAAIVPPPPYKMALLTWLTIFPVITLVVVALGPLLEEVALVPRLAVTSAVTVPLMTWVVMPRVTRLLRDWLYPAPANRQWQEIPPRG